MPYEDNNRRNFNSDRPMIVRRTLVTAILVDGGFYRRRARELFGEKEPADRADELMEYCRRHIRAARSNLYRIFFYDCPPSSKVLYHPLLQRHVNLSQTHQYQWSQDFFSELIKKRKVAFRRGEELVSNHGYYLKPESLKRLCSGRLSVEELAPTDFGLDMTQKGIDMRLGLDISSLAEQRIVNQIILISGDSDFVPAAKLARRAGIDFILDPMWAPISDTLSEHVDGIQVCVRPPMDNLNDPLHVDNYRFVSRGSDNSQELDDIDM